MPQAFVQLDRLNKSYGPVPAVTDLSIEIAKGEALTLLGPSGCGKTTTLRMVAGLEKPDARRDPDRRQPVVAIAERINVPPEKRDIGMVFQSYAIWPHMTVAQNVAFPLKVRARRCGDDPRSVRAALNWSALAASRTGRRRA